jgi:ParB family chromosome partitioning protein
MKRAVGWNPELEHVQVRSLDSIFPAPDNDVIYRALALDDPEIIELAKSIKEHGLLDPLLISQDGFIISGHRRRMASLRAGLKEVPVKIYPMSRNKSPDEFRRLLVEANSQRLKNVAEMVHESAIKIDAKAAYQQIVNDRQESKIAVAKIFR